MSNDKEDNRRLTDYLTDYWNEKRGKKAFPELSDIDIEEFEPKFARDSFLIELIPTVTMNITKTLYLGSNLNSEFKKDSSGVHIKNLVVRFLETPMDAYNKVVETKKPLEQNIEIPCKEIADLRYRQILLPLGDADKEEVKGILGGMRYKKRQIINLPFYHSFLIGFLLLNLLLDFLNYQNPQHQNLQMSAKMIISHY